MKEQGRNKTKQFLEFFPFPINEGKTRNAKFREIWRF